MPNVVILALPPIPLPLIPKGILPTPSVPHSIQPPLPTPSSPPSFLPTPSVHSPFPPPHSNPPRGQVEQKQRYAAWKAADIRRALAEGRQPTPGPPPADSAGAAALLSAPAGASPAAPAAAPDSAGGAGNAGQHDILGLPVPPSVQPLRPDHSGAAPGGGGATAAGGGGGVGGGWAQGGGLQGAGVGRPHGGGAGELAAPKGCLTALFSPLSQPSCVDMRILASLPHCDILVVPGTTSSIGPAGMGAPRAAAAAPSSFSAPLPAASQPTATATATAGTATGTSTGSTQGTGTGTGTGMGMGGQAPPAGKVGDAHRAARFAVSALAFDDVPAALDYLKQALQLLDGM
ncbi:unnamed protein product [Closterium sp. NIES-54]